MSRLAFSQVIASDPEGRTQAGRVWLGSSPEVIPFLIIDPCPRPGSVTNVNLGFWDLVRGEVSVDADPICKLTSRGPFAPLVCLYWDGGARIGVAADGSVSVADPRPGYVFEVADRKPEGLLVLPSGETRVVAAYSTTAGITLEVRPDPRESGETTPLVPPAEVTVLGWVDDIALAGGRLELIIEARTAADGDSLNSLCRAVVESSEVRWQVLARRLDVEDVGPWSKMARVGEIYRPRFPWTSS